MKPFLMRYVPVKRCTYVLLAMAFSLIANAGEHAPGHDNETGKNGQKMFEKNKDKKAWEKEHESKKEEIMREISFLAKKLLDSSGKDSLVVKSSAFLKPFIGICPMVHDQGIKLSCITPASQAEKHGLKTGDIITIIDGVKMAKTEVKTSDSHKHPYWGLMNEMKTGDVLDFDVLRAGETIKLKVTVGSISHPAYELKITG